ncbi:MAG TPA: chemotaxis protein CheA [Devosiaceae bacterium]|nr:chemotaxis protein CheA [Devosiaceae bacterium]
MISADPADTFRQEARELLEQLELGLLDLEQNPGNADLINSTFRALHTIKGSGAMFGFTSVAEFVHEFETAFDRVRKGQSAPTPELIAVALDAKDHVHKLIEQPGADIAGGEAILAALRIAVSGEAAAEPHEPVAAIPTAGPAVPKSGRWRVRFRLPSDSLIYGTNPLLLLEEIAEIGPCEVTALTDAVPMLDELDPEVPYIGWQVDLTAADPRGAIDDVFMFLKDGMQLSVEPLAEAVAAPVVRAIQEPPTPKAEAPAMPVPAPKPAAEKAAAKEPAKAASAEKAGSSLRVDAERLDELMDRVGELVIAQSRLNQIAANSADGNLKSIAEELGRLSSGLRDTTMGIRMVPIGTLFSRFRRLVHDLSRDLGKEIEFITTGEETELDKTMIERLADPLVHLIRNSVDHGLEPAEKRLAAGKSTQGTVRLSAVYAGAEVAISVSDDGAGLNAARIRAKAEEQGLLTPESKISEQDLFQLIFSPGFSTAKEITALSGRGVGMDVVKRTIDGLRGSIELSTVPGKGTTATLRLPLTLAIIDGMLVRVGNGRYTIPLSAVEECVELPAGAQSGSRGRNFLDIRGSLVPFMRLREVFNTEGEADAHQKVVIVSSMEGRVGLVVDQIIGNNQAVIKHLSKLHAGLKWFSGATILGDGTVALILDTAHLVGFGHVHEDRYKSEPTRAA